jgi:hypothetical protein
MTQYDYATDPTGARAAEGGSTADQVKEQVKDKAQVAQDRARAATGQARSRFREQVDQRSTLAGERASATAQDVRSVADGLRQQGKEAPARLAEQAADRVDHVGRYLRSADADRLLTDVEDFARRRPWAVAAAGLALGFAASRVLKASSRQRYQSYQDRGRGPSRSWFDDGGYERTGTSYADTAYSDTAYSDTSYSDTSYAGTSADEGAYGTGTGTGTGTAYTTDPAATGSDYATTRAYPEPASEPLGAETPLTGTYDPDDPRTTIQPPADAYDPAAEPVDPRRRPSDPEPLT